MKSNDTDPSLLATLEERFSRHMHRHKGVAWADVRARLEADKAVLRTLEQMEATGGEPDLITLHGGRDRFAFCDCSPQSPAGRRSLCYDAQALAARKEHKPAGSAVELAASMGIELMTEDLYRQLQQFGEFDTKTSSWVLTPPDVRRLGGALFCDRRYGQVFVYHNGADSYYAARGFRGLLRLSLS